MGSLVQAAVDHGHEALLLLTDPGERKPGEATTAEDLARWPAARVLPFEPDASLGADARARACRRPRGPVAALPALEHGCGGRHPAMRTAGVRFYSVDYILEALNSRPRPTASWTARSTRASSRRPWHWQGSPSRATSSRCAGRRPIRPQRDRRLHHAERLALVDRVAVDVTWDRTRPADGAVHVRLNLAVPEPGGDTSGATGRRCSPRAGPRPPARRSRPRDLERERVPRAGPGHPPIL